MKSRVPCDFIAAIAVKKIIVAYGFCMLRKGRNMGTNKKSYDAVYLRNYRENNPERAEQWRISSEIRHLEKLGYVIIKPKERPKAPQEMTDAELEESAVVIETDIEKRKRQNRDACRRWREKNQDHVREYQKQWKEKNKDRIKVDPEKRRIYKARWRAKNREKLREQSRAWYAEHKEQAAEYQRKWMAKNPDYAKRRRAREKARLDAIRKEQRARIRRDTKANKAAQQKGVNADD